MIVNLLHLPSKDLVMGQIQTSEELKANATYKILSPDMQIVHIFDANNNFVEFKQEQLAPPEISFRSRLQSQIFKQLSLVEEYCQQAKQFHYVSIQLPVTSKIIIYFKYESSIDTFNKRKVQFPIIYEENSDCQFGQLMFKKTESGAPIFIFYYIQCENELILAKFLDEFQKKQFQCFYSEIQQNLNYNEPVVHQTVQLINYQFNTCYVDLLTNNIRVLQQDQFPKNRNFPGYTKTRSGIAKSLGQELERQQNLFPCSETLVFLLEDIQEIVLVPRIKACNNLIIIQTNDSIPLHVVIGSVRGYLSYLLVLTKLNIQKLTFQNYFRLQTVLAWLQLFFCSHSQEFIKEFRQLIRTINYNEFYDLNIDVDYYLYAPYTNLQRIEIQALYFASFLSDVLVDDLQFEDKQIEYQQVVKDCVEQIRNNASSQPQFAFYPDNSMFPKNSITIYHLLSELNMDKCMVMPISFTVSLEADKNLVVFQKGISSMPLLSDSLNESIHVSSTSSFHLDYKSYQQHIKEAINKMLYGLMLKINYKAGHEVSTETQFYFQNPVLCNTHQQFVINQLKFLSGDKRDSILIQQKENFVRFHQNSFPMYIHQFVNDEKQIYSSIECTLVQESIQQSESLDPKQLNNIIKQFCRGDHIKQFHNTINFTQIQPFDLNFIVAPLLQFNGSEPSKQVEIINLVAYRLATTFHYLTFQQFLSTLKQENLVEFIEFTIHSKALFNQHNGGQQLTTLFLLVEELKVLFRGVVMQNRNFETSKQSLKFLEFVCDDDYFYNFCDYIIKNDNGNQWFDDMKLLFIRQLVKYKNNIGGSNLEQIVAKLFAKRPQEVLIGLMFTNDDILLKLNFDDVVVSPKLLFHFIHVQRRLFNRIFNIGDYSESEVLFQNIQISPQYGLSSMNKQTIYEVVQELNNNGKLTETVFNLRSGDARQLAYCFDLLDYLDWNLYGMKFFQLTSFNHPRAGTMFWFSELSCPACMFGNCNCCEFAVSLALCARESSCEANQQLIQQTKLYLSQIADGCIGIRFQVELNQLVQEGQLGLSNKRFLARGAIRDLDCGIRSNFLEGQQRAAVNEDGCRQVVFSFGNRVLASRFLRGK